MYTNPTCIHWEDICISTLPDSLRSLLFALFFFLQTKKGNWWHANFSRSCWHLIRDRDTYIDVNIDKKDFYPILMQTLTKVSISGNIPIILFYCQTILEIHFTTFFITFFISDITFYKSPYQDKILLLSYSTAKKSRNHLPFLVFQFFIGDLELRTLVQM